MIRSRIFWAGVLGCGLAGCVRTGQPDKAAPSDNPSAERSPAGATPVKVDSDGPVEVQETKWPNGNLKTRTEGKKDADGNFIRHGTSTVWYENGQKKSEQRFTDGVPNGPRNTWYIEGRKWTEGEYVDGLEDGTWRAWYPDGTPQTEWTMARGVWHGLYTEWHTNGKKRIEVEFVQGKRQGPVTTWDEQGVVVFRSDYVDGVEQP
jgi:antitoxin component YwqK of YwqJK toxin-antitoxin module